MRDPPHDPPGPGVDEFSPTAAPIAPPKSRPPTSGPPVTPGGVLFSLDSLGPPVGAPPSAATEAATGIPRRSDDSVDHLIGTVLAERYRIDRRLGAGGMGAVYAGFHVTLNKRIALKVVQPRLGADPTIAQRFVNEARAASAIGHEHIVQITDFGRTADDAAFIVMELLEGEDLSETLRREGPLPWRRVVHIGEQIAWALAAAHRQGIVHRDIKPANCYRVAREQDPDFIKVLDFGLAKVLAEQRDGESLTGTGMLLGTPGYIAPELYRGLKADHRVDIYALGALMHKLLTGELPPMASGSGHVDVMRTVNVPDTVVAVFRRALAEVPDDRYATAHDLAAALRAIPRVSADLPTQLGQADGAPTQPTRLTRSEPGSAQSLTPHEPTPSLFTVERQGHRVRFYIGAPLLVLLVVLGVGLTLYLIRPASFIDEARRTFQERLLAVAISDRAGPADRAGPPDSPALPPQPPLPTMPPEPAPLPAPPVIASPPAELTPPELNAGPAPVPAAPVKASPPTAEPVPIADDPTPPPTAEPVPKDMPPGPAPVAAPKRLRGSAVSLGKCLTRKCDLETLSFTIELAWKTDERGLVISSTVVGKDGKREVLDCAVPRVRQCPLVWAPSTAYSEKIKLGTSAADKAPQAD